MTVKEDGLYADLLDEFEELVDEADEAARAGIFTVVDEDGEEVYAIPVEDDTCYCDCCREKVMQCDGDPVEKEYAVTISVGVDIDFTAVARNDTEAEDIALSMFNSFGIEQALKESDCYATSEPDVMASWEIKD